MNDKMFVNEFNKLRSRIELDVKSLSNWQYEELSKVKQTVRDIINKSSDLESLVDQKQWDEGNF